MKQYVLLVQNKSDRDDRYWVIKNSLEDAFKCKRGFDDKYYVYIHELGQSY